MVLMSDTATVECRVLVGVVTCKAVSCLCLDHQVEVTGKRVACYVH